MKQYTVTEPYLDLRCGLAEGPMWERDANVLRFVDIVNHHVYRVDLAAGPSSLKKVEYPMSVSVTAELEGHPDSFIFGGKEGIGISKKESAEFRYVKPYWTDDEAADGKPRRMRANDGMVDSKGRFWCSVMRDSLVAELAPEGGLFRLDTDASSLHRVISDITIPNGMSWSADDKTLYFTDTTNQTIWAYDYDAESGDLGERRVFWKPDQPGVGPDGHAQDADGNLWVALWGSWKVVCVSPQGEVTAEIHVPTRCPTAVAFAGEDVYITSEADPEADKRPDSAKYHGSVFKCHVGVQGKPHVAAKLHV